MKLDIHIRVDSLDTCSNKCPFLDIIDGICLLFSEKLSQSNDEIFMRSWRCEESTTTYDGEDYEYNNEVN